MGSQLITLAVPIFFLLIGLEWLWSYLCGKQVYRLNDSITDLSCGMVHQITDIALKLLLIGAYIWLYNQAALLTIPIDHIGSWIAALLIVDLAFYWYHRMSHEINLIWAGHIVHHQSEEFNLTVALRQSILGPIFKMPFWLCLAVIGFPPAMFVTAAAINRLYQFWIHTQAIDKMGFLEHVLNTPSHHRVHHARNPEYIDRNYGGMFIFWDRMFGTFEPERHRPTYGITKPLNSWNPLWANLHYPVELYQMARQSTNWGDRLAVFVKRPGWRPEDQGGFQAPPALEEEIRKYDAQPSKTGTWYLTLQFVMITLLTALLLNTQKDLSVIETIVLGVQLLWGLTNIGALLEQRSWSRTSEIARLLLFPAISFAIPVSLPMALAVTLLVASCSLLWLFMMRQGNQLQTI